MSAVEVDEKISRKYLLKRRLGKGAYGIVWKAIDRQTGEVVAVKKIFDAFRNRTDAQRTFREILLLQEFGNHDNVIKLLNVIRAANDRDIYLVFEFMETDLHAVIRKGNLLKDIHIRYILYQLLKATKYIHSGNVIHRDQKPSNILLDSDCFVKLCDFGLARCINQIQEEQGNPALTEYVATRWYRAPEILLASPRYTKGVDMWSVGCILGEMLLGKPLFPGTSSINQIERIMSVIPAPSNEDVQSINSDYGASVVQKVLTRPRTSIDQLLPSSTPPDALDLLNKLLIFNPDYRLTAEQALGHPYLSRFHNPSKEPRLDYDIVLPVDDDTQLSVAEYRNKLYQMILERKANARLQRQLMKEPEPLKSPLVVEPKEVTSAISSTPAIVDSGISAHKEKGLSHLTTNVTLYNPITHSPLIYAAAPKAAWPAEFLQYFVCVAWISSICRLQAYDVISRRQTHCGSTAPPQWAPRLNQGGDIHGAQEHCRTQYQHPDVQQMTAAPQAPSYTEAHRTKSATVPRVRPVSHHCRTAVHSVLSRKETGHQEMGMAISCALLNPRPQSQSRENRPVKKMFQMTSNMEAAGNPKAAWGSYSQTYGVISQTGLENLRNFQRQNKP
ncbi:mitogen-activated protein kinase 15 isoform X2 [Hemitrygon akajei]|uniref:mitogen-activated protein kinase 15 isoform X2 n=1 Tax=Hemitrygon akajei TaxID=2704970 RepID=UPI003BFA2E72